MSAIRTEHCVEVEDAIADILEGNAPARLIDHLATCDRCRDLRHDIDQVQSLMEKAGADFQPEPGFEDRVLEAALAARPDAPRPTADSIPTQSGEVLKTQAATAPTEFAPNTLAEMTRESQPLDGARTTFEPTNHAETDNRTTFDPTAFERASEVAGETKASLDLPRESFTPSVKTVPIQAYIASRDSKVMAQSTPQPTPVPSSDARARVVEAVTGSASNTAPGATVNTNPPIAAAGQQTLDSAIDLDVRKDAPRPSPRESARVVPLFRRGGFLAAVGGGMAAAAAVGYFYLGRPKGDEGPVAFKDGAWSGTVAEVARASSDGGVGFEVCDKENTCQPGIAGAKIAAGSTLKTDAKTRAKLTLADGTTLSLDRSSEVVLPAGDLREARIDRGLVVVDVATIEGAEPAKLILPEGEVKVIGTKLAVTLSEKRSSVEVLRGEVKVGSSAKWTSVRAGEEATLVQGSEPIVSQRNTMSDALEWSSESQDDVDAAALRGLGELKARKPGQTQEKDKAVRLSKHAVKVRVVDVIARTEIDETFTNDTDEELEGIFRFPLPPGAQIERLALEVDGKLIDGAFVDRDRGAAIWRGVIQNAAPKTPRTREEIVWVPGPWRDPALLEWQRGGRFELKIFPIPKKGSRRVVLSYTQPVPQSGGIRRFSYPLAHDASGSTKIDDFSLDVQVLGNDRSFGVTTRGYSLASTPGATADRFAIQEKNFVPAGDLTVEYALPNRNSEMTAWAYELPSSQAATNAAGTSPTISGAPLATNKVLTAADRTKAGEAQAKALTDDTSPYVAISVRPKLPRWGEGKERLHVIVVDSSRSMIGERFARGTRLATSLVREMDRRDSFMVMACDVTCQGMGAGPGRPLPAVKVPSPEAAEEVEKFLGSLEPDGGSNLFAAVQAARAAAGNLQGKELRLIMLGDGTPTVGPTKPAVLEAAVRQAMPLGEGAVVAVPLGSDADTTTLAAIARGAGGVVVPYVPGQKVSGAAIDVLASAYGSVLSDIAVELPPGLTEITPRSIDPVPAGGETFIFARMTGGKSVEGNVKIKGRVGRETFEQTYPTKIVSSTSEGNAFVPRLFAAAKIGELDQAGRVDDREAIVALSKRFGVASRHTSMIVLESEAMFKAFGLDKNSIESRFSGEALAASSSADADGEEDAEEQRKSGDLDKSAEKKKDSAGAGPSLADLRSEGESAPRDDGLGFGGGATGSSRAQSPAKEPASKPATASPTATTAPSEAPKAARRPNEVAADPFSDEWNRPRPRPDGRARIPMRRVFDRKATFAAGNTLATDLASTLADLETQSKNSPDSRDKTLALYKSLMASGRVGEAQELTARWSQRDALDPDALKARADLAAMAGDRERAMRILSGLADVRPGDKQVQERLITAFTQMGAKDLACQHRLALADIDARNVTTVASAVRCSQDMGFGGISQAVLTSSSSDLRTGIEAAARTVKLDASPLGGDVRVSATWSGAADLDVALIDKLGNRISWLGSPLKNVTVTSANASSSQTEQLGLFGMNNGKFVIEVARASSANNQPISGEVTLTLPGGETRKVPFTLTGSRVEIGSLNVFFTSRLVPIDSFGGGGGWRNF